MRFLLILILAGVAAHACGPYSYAFTSTPFTPPEGFLWTPLLFIGLFALANTFLLRWLWRHGWATSFGLALLMAFAVFAFTTLITVNVNHPNATHAAWGSRVFWGWGLKDINVAGMLIGNLPALCALFGSTLLLTSWRNDGSANGRSIFAVGFTLLILHVAAQLVFPLSTLYPRIGIIAFALLAIVAGIRQAIVRFGWKSLAIVGVNLVVLAAGMTPFALSGAYQHGHLEWGPCSHSVHTIGRGLYTYACLHQGRLPVARTIDELFAALATDDDQFSSRHQHCASMVLWHTTKPYPYTTCYAAQIYDRHPRTYTWNAAASGMRIDELRALETPMVLVSCPYHESVQLTSKDVVKRYDELMPQMRERKKRKEQATAP